jgi:hypothetical protein
MTAWAGVTAVDASAGAMGTDNTLELPSVTTSGPNRLVLTAYGQIGSVTYTPALGFTENFDVKNPSATYYASGSQASRVQASAGATGVAIATASSSGGGWMGQTIALR